MMKNRFCTLLVAALVGVLSASASAHEWNLEGKSVKNAIEYRNSVMTIFSWNMKSMGAMAEGKTDFVPKEFAKHARDLERAVHLDLLEGFPEDSTEGFTGALPDIWLDWEGFEEKYHALQERVAALTQAVEDRDKAELKAAFKAVDEACGNCHDRFKD